MEDKEFTVDDQGTQKVLRDCIEDERQYILETGYDIFARESPPSEKVKRIREWEAGRTAACGELMDKTELNK